MNINFDMVFVIPLTQYVIVILKFSNHRYKLLDNINRIDKTILTLSDKEITEMLLYGSPNYSFFTKNNILALTIEFFKSTKRFDKPLC